MAQFHPHHDISDPVNLGDIHWYNLEISGQNCVHLVPSKNRFNGVDLFDVGY